MVCVRCGEEIPDTMNSVKYCSRRCSKLYLKSNYRARNRNKILEYAAKYREKNRDILLQKRRDYNIAHPNYRREKVPLTPEEIKERQIRRALNYNGKYPARKAAARAVRLALESGRLLKPKYCQFCKSTKIGAHHEDYTKPLEVIWVCAKHHSKIQKDANFRWSELEQILFLLSPTDKK